MTASVSRRDFLQASGACLLIAIGPTPRRIEPRGDDVFAPGPYLRIDETGIVTISGYKQEMGQGIHTAIAMIVAEELDADWRQVRVELTPPDERLNMGTFGSRSVRENYAPLRAAGAAARHALVFAAGLEWKVPVNGITVREGVVLHAATGRRLPFGQLVKAANRVPLQVRPTLKSPETFTIIGKSLPRVDTPAKVDGSATFGVDVRLPGVRYACLVRPPVLGAKLAGFDDAAARKLPGVVRVVQVEDAVAVVATNTWSAMRGARAIVPRWSETPNAQLSSALIQERLRAESKEAPIVARSEGDTTAALSNAARQVTAEYTVPYLAHATMEPQNCTAIVTSERAEVWVPTQTPHGVRETVAAVSGLPLHQVTVHPTYLGGGFGRRGRQDFVREAILVARAVGGPVQTVWTREDDMRNDYYRPATFNRLSAAVDAEGALLAWHHCIASQSILTTMGRPHEGADPTSVEGALDPPYAIANLKIDYCKVAAPVPIGPWRSVGHSQNIFVVESFFDEVAALAGVDPAEFRLRHIRNPRLHRVVELAMEKSEWKKPLASGRFRGIACAAIYGSFVAEVAEVSVEKGMVRVHRVVAAIDCGQVINPNIVAAQMEGGIVYGLTAALYGEITYKDGRVEQGNFNDYPLLRFPEMPRTEVHIVPSREAPGGVGEPGTPLIAPAVANAVSAAIGKRVRSLPVRSA